MAERWDARRDARDRVLHRTRATAADGTSFRLTLVDLSPRGFMARTDVAAVAGDGLTIELPMVGSIDAEVRWVLGGRIGCRLDTPIAEADYSVLLAALRPT